MNKGIRYVAALGLAGLMAVTAAAADTLPTSNGLTAAEAAEDTVAHTVAEGTCGEDLTWVLDDTGLLTVEGTGKMDNCYYGAPWNAYLASITSVVIGDEVTMVGHYAFQNCANLQSVTIGDEVENIGGGAFKNCTSLETITWGNSVTNISGSSFYDCNSLVKVEIPDTVTTIQNEAFYNCDSLTEVVLGRGVTTIDKNVFTACPKLTTLTVSDALKTVWGDGDTRTGSFIESPITTIYVPATVSSIPADLYNYASIANFVCESTKEDAGMLNISGDGYFDDDGVLYRYNVDSGVQTLVKYPSMMTVPESGYVVLNGTHTIGEKAFHANETLETLVIPDTVTSIEREACHDCTMLTSVTFGKNVQSIGKSAFENCKKLPAIELNEGLVDIGECAFYGCNMLRTVAFPDSVTTIQSSAFENCERLANVVLGKNVTSLGKSAFVACPKLTTLTLSNGLTEVWSQGTYGTFTNTPIQVIHVPATVTNIPENLFTYSTLTAFVCEATAETAKTSTNVGGNCYFDDDGVLYLYNVQTGTQTLMKCPQSKTFTAFTYTIPTGTNTITKSAFEYNTNLKRIHIPASVTTIEKYACNGCSYLLAAYFYGNAPETLGVDVFAKVHENFKIYYVNGKLGWTNPWNGYTTETFTPVIVEPEPEPDPDVPSKGDINGDGVVDAADLTLLQQYFCGYPTTIDFTQDLDFNHDGTFTRADVMYLARALAGWDGYSVS